MDNRLQLLTNWLMSHFKTSHFEISPLAADASFRRYFRIRHQDTTYVAMDAPPEHENSRPFVAIAQTFLQQGIKVPKIFHHDLSQGFLLLSDLGDALYINELNHNNAEQLYHNAFEPLLRIQHCQHFVNWELPIFDATFMHLELQRFQDWFLQQHLQLTLTPHSANVIHKLFERIIQVTLEQPRCCVHRDYHAGNLLRLPENQVGILDFQDAVIGPVTYDIVFMLRDCRIDFQANDVEKWALDFYSSLNLPSFSSSQFLYWFDWMGLQTHLKVLGIFARLAIRDKKPRYLQHIPRIVNYIYQVCDRYSELAEFKLFLNDTICSEVIA